MTLNPRALGMDFLSPEEMSAACESYLQEMLFEGVEENIAIHHQPGGWYSEAVMAYALRAKQNIYILDVDDPIRVNDPNDPLRIYAAEVRGIIVNIEESHWIAFRYLENQIWHLDSCHSPKTITYEDFVILIQEYEYAFVLRTLY